MQKSQVKSSGCFYVLADFYAVKDNERFLINAFAVTLEPKVGVPQPTGECIFYVKRHYNLLK